MAAGVAEFRFYYDIGSMYSYFAFHVLKNYVLNKDSAALCVTSSYPPPLGCHVSFRGDGGIWPSVRVCLCPVLVGGIFKQTGNQAPATLPAKAAYTMKDTERISLELNIPCSIPSFFPINSLQVMRLLTTIALYAPDQLWRVTHQFFQSYWGDGLNLQDVRVLEQILSNCFTSSEGQLLMTRSQEQQVKDCLKATTDAAVDSGAFGVPWFSIPSLPVAPLDASRIVETIQNRQVAVTNM
eukprot:GHVS01071265.1.p1 GENE.GHVS01071265.1~~GHVS01071265.1.p1  ORF type:complete len:239 (-),score=31.71 GHVS01071265.1:416-1132(-)